MSITDELRKYVGNFYLFRYKDVRESLTAIADRIDAEHQKAIRELNNLADASVLLPVDADGVPTRVGDKVYQVEGGWVYTVKSITFYPENTTVSFEGKHGFGCDSAHNVRHYHEPTVEDMLWELLGKITPLMEDDEAVPIVAAYAERLRLADDGKEQ